MAQISSTIGLISGINTKDIIDQLIAIEAEQSTLIEARVATIEVQKNAFTDLGSMLSTVQSSGFALSRPTTFNTTVAKSSNDDVLTATTAAGASVGNYQFQVARLVSTQQDVSQGFASQTSSVGTGVLTIEMGNGKVSSETLLSQLNGGAGATRGQFRITDGTGATTVIDTSDAVSLDDVVTKINTAVSVNVRATVSGNHIVLTDASTGTGTMTVTDLASGTAASSLGIAGSATSKVITGTNIDGVTGATLLSSLNDGRGVRTSTATSKTDFNITDRAGSSFAVNLSTASTVADVQNAISTASGGLVTATINATTNNLVLTDTSIGLATFKVTAQNGSNAAADLGLTAAASGGTITGKTVLAGLDSVLVSSLAGGAGLALGKLDVKDAAGHTSTVNLATATSVSDIVAAINANTTVKLKASVNAAGDGIQVQDISGGTGKLAITNDVDGKNTATQLGLLGTVSSGSTTLSGKNLERKWASETTKLADYNGGRGINTGTFSISNSKGIQSTITIDSTDQTLGDVITTINAANAGVTASINTNGDGLLLTDTAGGANKLTVANISGTTASDLQLAGTATGTTINGTFEKYVTVGASDTLTSVQQAVSSLGFGVKASIINDGSAASPYRLSITAVNSGSDGQVVFDTGTTSFNMSELSHAEDAAVLVGGTGSAQPILVTSSSNTVTGVLNGVTLSLNSVSDAPVSLNITNDVDSIVTDMNDFVTGFNSTVTQINTDTKFDTTTDTGGILLGDYTTQDIQQKLYSVITDNVTTAGKYKTFTDLGITVNDDGTLKFDEDTFRAAYADDPDAIKTLFTQTDTGLGAKLTNVMTQLIDPVNGVLTLQSNTLDTRAQQYQDRITELSVQLDSKRSRLELQFANMETTLANLQSQQSAISSIGSASSSK